MRKRIAQLNDGSTIAIRAITPADRQGLLDGFDRLGPESRYRRFFGPVAHLGERELDYLTDVDHHDHEALVAIDAATGEGVAVARFIRGADDSAEPAIAVIDDWQGRGVAGALLGALADRAREEGITRFVAPVLAENASAIKVFHRLGATAHEILGRELELTIDLDQPVTPEPALREVLRAVASGLVEPARSVWELLMRQRTVPDGFGEAIVVGIDSVEGAGAAVDSARELALRLKLPVRLVAGYRPLLDDAAALRSSLERAESRLQGDGVEVSSRLQRGDPALTVLSAAVRERAGLIVLASPPAGGGQTRGSSLWNAVAHNAQCHVLIARPPRT